jgi:hypothetical protein
MTQPRVRVSIAAALIAGVAASALAVAGDDPAAGAAVLQLNQRVLSTADLPGFAAKAPPRVSFDAKSYANLVGEPALAARLQRIGFKQSVYHVRRGPKGTAAYSVVIQFATPAAAKGEIARLSREYSKDPEATRVAVPGVPSATALEYAGNSSEVLFADGPFTYDLSLTKGSQAEPDTAMLVKASRALYTRVRGKGAPPEG